MSKKSLKNKLIFLVDLIPILTWKVGGTGAKTTILSCLGIWDFCNKKHKTLLELPLRWENSKGDKMTQEVKLPLILVLGLALGREINLSSVAICPPLTVMEIDVNM